MADYNETNAERVAKTLGDAGFDCSVLRCDLGNRSDIERLVAEAERHGRVKYVVNPTLPKNDNFEVISGGLRA